MLPLVPLSHLTLQSARPKTQSDFSNHPKPRDSKQLSIPSRSGNSPINRLLLLLDICRITTSHIPPSTSPNLIRENPRRRTLVDDTGLASHVTTVIVDVFEVESVDVTGEVAEEGEEDVDE